MGSESDSSNLHDKDNERAQEPADETSDDLSEFDDDQLLPLEYARRYGLTKSHLYNPYDAVDSPPSPGVTRADLQDPASTSNVNDVFSDKEVERFTAGEKWDVDRGTATFLASVGALGKDDPALNPQQIDGPVYLCDLKLEEAILASDPDMDLWQLKSRNTVAISLNGMRAFELEVGKGEALAWSTTELQAYSDVENFISNEKFDVNVETSTYLKDEILSLGRQTDENIMLTSLDHRAVRSKRAITPPLLPISPPLSPAEPFTSSMEMQLTSTPDDLNAKEAAQVELHLLERDDALHSPASTARGPHVDTNQDVGKTHSPLRTPEYSSSSPCQFRKLQDFHLDAPLIPERREESPAKKVKSVSFPTELLKIIPSSNADATTSDFEQGYESFLTEVVKPLAEPAIQKAENEHLVEFDTTLRVTAPYVEDVELNRPWKDIESKGPTGQSHKGVLSNVKAGVAGHERKWSGVEKLERLLPWTPFPTRLGKVQLDETFDDGSLARYMAAISVEDHVNVEDLVWKPEGLRVLDAEDSDDDELEKLEVEDGDELLQNDRACAPDGVSALPTRDPNVAKILDKTESETARPPRVDMQTLLRKRKLELEGADHAKRRSRQPDGIATETKVQRDPTSKPARSGVLEDIGGLSRFMQLHGGRANLMDMPHEQPVSILQQPPTRAAVVQPESRMKEPLAPASTTAVPEIRGVEVQGYIVLSADMSTNRQLVRQISTLLPKIDTIERESIELSGTNILTASKQADRYEADITLSPSTGLILTTLQKLKQKPLPGQYKYFGVCDRVQNVAVRYERLLVLVSEARQHLDGDPAMAGPLDEIDSEALSDLIGFGAALTTDVEVYYAAGGESELAQWVAALVSRHSTFDVDMKLLHDETLWERLLRHTGLNAYGAQMVLSQLKRSEESKEQRSSFTVGSCDVPTYGLAAFAQMTAEQRVQRFGPLMAGERVLRRVNGIIDSQWMSASTTKH